MLIFENISKLEPGNFLKIPLNDLQNVKATSWWDLNIKENNEMFYFVIVQEKEGEVYVEKNS